MRYAGRYLPPLVILLPLVFICGKLLLTPAADKAAPFEYQGIVRGWPWAFQWMNAGYLSGGGEETFKSSLAVAPLIADASVLLLAIVVCALLLARHYRRRGGWFRVSL